MPWPLRIQIFDPRGLSGRERQSSAALKRVSLSTSAPHAAQMQPRTPSSGTSDRGSSASEAARPQFRRSNKLVLNGGAEEAFPYTAWQRTVTSKPLYRECLSRAFTVLVKLIHLGDDCALQLRKHLFAVTHSGS